MDATTKHYVMNIDGGERKSSGVELAIEEPLEIRINGKPYAVIMRSPGGEIELACGFCLTEGIVDSFSEIAGAGFCADAADNASNVVNIVLTDACGEKRGSESEDLRLSSGRKYESRSGCGICGVEMLDGLRKKVRPIESDMKAGAADLMKMQRAMVEHQSLGARTMSTHAAALFKPDGTFIAVREDVGRHNALDKVIGFAMMNGVNTGVCVAFLSSRISFEMAQKAARAAIPIVCAVSAATSMAVELADSLNCCLTGRMRDDSMTVYTCRDRIVF
jgi:FdhD protein